MISQPRRRDQWRRLLAQLTALHGRRADGGGAAVRNRREVADVTPILVIIVLL